MAAFIVSGTGDEALARLKAYQEASEASFKAALARIFKSSPKVPTPPQPPAPASAGKAAASNRKRSSHNRLRP